MVILQNNEINLKVVVFGNKTWLFQCFARNPLEINDVRVIICCLLEHKFAIAFDWSDFVVFISYMWNVGGHAEWGQSFVGTLSMMQDRLSWNGFSNDMGELNGWIWSLVSLCSFLTGY
jgi:hypothetical protein